MITFIYTLSKLLPLFILPLGLSFCILFFGLRTKSIKYIKAVVILLWPFSIGFTSHLLWKWIEYPWERIKAKNASTADVIVVLSGGSHLQTKGPDKLFEWTTSDRFLSGIKLFKEKKAPKLLFTGGASPYITDPQNEGSLSRFKAMQLGIPSESIATTRRVFNTKDEAIATRHRLSSDSSTTKILLVTSAFHMHRAKKEFERQGFIVYPFPVAFQVSTRRIMADWENPYNWFPNAQSLAKSSEALREIIGRTIFRAW